MIKSLGDIYEQVRTVLRPAPSKPHYLFNLKDVARVVQGLQLVASKSKPTKDKSKSKLTSADNHEDQSGTQTILLVKLFCHEALRVFCDRITDKDGTFKQIAFIIYYNMTIHSYLECF